MIKIAVVHKVTWTQEEWLRLKALGDVRYTFDLPSGMDAPGSILPCHG